MFSSLPELPAISPAPSFKSIDMNGCSSQYLTHSFASIYWSYPSLAAQSNGPSRATSTASFRTALEQIEDDEENTDDNEDDDVSFSSIATSKRDLNAPLGKRACDTKNTFQIVTSKPKTDIPSEGRSWKKDDVWVKRPEFRPICQPLEAQPTKTAQKYAKPNGTPLGIKRFKDKSLIVGYEEKAKRVDKQNADKSSKDALNSSF